MRYICRPIADAISPGGGIGRRAGLKHLCLRAYRFDSGPGHQTAKGSHFSESFFLALSQKRSGLQAPSARGALALLLREI